MVTKGESEEMKTLKDVLKVSGALLIAFAMLFVSGYGA